MEKEQEKKVKWITAILTNDEASTDQELTEHLVKEGGLTEAQAKACAYYREAAQQGKDAYVEVCVKEILDGDQGTILDKTKDHNWKENDEKAMDHVMRTRRERPDHYNLANSHVKAMGLQGLWRGQWLAVSETIKLIELVEKRCRHSVECEKELTDHMGQMQIGIDEAGNYVAKDDQTENR